MVGSSSLQDETQQGCLDLWCTTRPLCFDQDANLIGNHGYVGLKLYGSWACWAKLISRLQSPNRLGVTSAIKCDCQRLSRVLLLSGIERKQSKLPFESLTMVRFQEENGSSELKFGL